MYTLIRLYVHVGSHCMCIIHVRFNSSQLSLEQDLCVFLCSQTFAQLKSIVSNKTAEFSVHVTTWDLWNTSNLWSLQTHTNQCTYTRILRSKWINAWICVRSERWKELEMRVALNKKKEKKKKRRNCQWEERDLATVCIAIGNNKFSVRLLSHHTAVRPNFGRCTVKCGCS